MSFSWFFSVFKDLLQHIYWGGITELSLKKCMHKYTFSGYSHVAIVQILQARLTSVMLFGKYLRYDKTLTYNLNLCLIAFHLRELFMCESTILRAFKSQLYLSVFSLIWLFENQRTSHQTFVLVKTYWRRLQDVFKTSSV